MKKAFAVLFAVPTLISIEWLSRQAHGQIIIWVTFIVVIAAVDAWSKEKNRSRK